MIVTASCHCGAVSYSVRSRTPDPYNRCFCSICRKTGGGGYAINIMGEAATLRVAGAENLTAYRAADNRRGLYEDDGLGVTRRHFCRHCGSSMYLTNANYPDAVYLCASAVDSDLPPAPAHSHYMIDDKANWVPIVERDGDHYFGAYPDFGIEDWHRRRGRYDDTD